MTTDFIGSSSRELGLSGSGSQQTAGATPAPGEMPVLFQVTDVNRPKSHRTQAPLATMVAAPAAATATAISPDANAAIASATSHEDPNVLRLSEMARPGALEASSLWPSSVASLLDDPSLLADTPAAAKPADVKADQAKPTPDAAKEPASSTVPPSPKAQTENQDTDKTDAGKNKDATAKDERPSPRRQPPKKDWFSTHGKLIAVGFVLALAATVVMARNKKQSVSPPSEEDSWALKHPGHAAELLAGDGPMIEMPGAGEKNVPSDAKPISKPGETSPAEADKLVEKKPANEKPAAEVDLLPPTLPQQSLVESATAKAFPPTPVASPAVPPVAAMDKPASEPVVPTTDPLFQLPPRDGQVAARSESPAVTYKPNPATTPVAPGEVLNPYAAAKHAANPPATTSGTAMNEPTTSGPAATVAARSPYVLPNSRQDVPPTAPPPSPASAYTSGGPSGGGYTEAPAATAGGAYAPPSAYSPAPAYTPAPAYSPAPPAPQGTTNLPSPQASLYGPAPTTPSPYMPMGGAGAMPPGGPAAPPTTNYGGPAAAGPNGMAPTGGAPMGAPNNPPTPGGYRYERTGSGLY